MGLVGRVKRVERAMGLSGPCPKCGGHGRVVVTFQAPGEPEPQPEGCPVCGSIVHIRFVTLSEDQLEAVGAQRRRGDERAKPERTGEKS